MNIRITPFSRCCHSAHYAVSVMSAEMTAAGYQVERIPGLNGIPSCLPHLEEHGITIGKFKLDNGAILMEVDGKVKWIPKRDFRNWRNYLEACKN